MGILENPPSSSSYNKEEQAIAVLLEGKFESVFKNRERPCILYQIKRCSGPCVGYIKKEEYKSSVEDAIEFVSGKSRKIQKNLSNQMEKASENLD